MKEHTKIYLASNGFDSSDFIPCEVCSTKAVDIHHIKARGMGGATSRNEPSNLMALCRSCHIAYGDKEQFLEFLIQKHKSLAQK